MKGPHGPVSLGMYGMAEGKTDWREWLRERIEEQKAQRSAQLAEALIEAQKTGKEPFDFDRLEAMYEMMPYISDSNWVPDAEYIAYCEYKYYVMHPEIMTLKEFAGFLEMMDIMNP